MTNSWIKAENLRLDADLSEMFYHQMMLIRKTEEALLDLFSKNELFGTTHTCLGQEINAVSILNAIDREKDTVWSNHRCHGHFLTYCGDVVGLLSEIMGKPTGVCGGRGGSQHLCAGNFYSSGIQGGYAPIAVGTAFADRSNGAITVAFLGDGTMGEGMVYESLNLASILPAPVLFVVEDNGIAQTTKTQTVLSGRIQDRGKSFGIKSVHYEGNVVEDLYKISLDAVKYVRSEGKPLWLTIKSTRLGPHSKGDDTRPIDEVKSLWEKDAVEELRKKISATVLKSIDDTCEKLVEAAVNLSREA